MIGQHFNQLTVLERAGTAVNGQPRWRCRCACGGETVLRADLIRGGQVKSCGCLPRSDGWKARARLRVSAIQARHPNGLTRRHGESYSGTYKSWCAMKRRCSSPRANGWKDYGGRGIEVCARWRDSFEAFLADMGPRPAGTSIDRFPNRDGHYEPGNCRWATPTEQQHNRRDNRVSQ